MSDHPESYGHWDHAQISELLHERDRLRASERSAWNAAVERDEKIERLRAEIAAVQLLAQDSIADSDRLSAEVAALKRALGTDWDGKSTLRMLTAERDALRELLRELRKVVHSSYAQKIDAALDREGK